MRDAFGGAFLIKILLVFLSIYIAFMASALAYAKAFRVKNHIINIIEEYEGHNDKAKAAIESYTKRVSYYVRLDPSLDSNRRCESNGYCVEKISGSRGTYFLVETFIRVELPFFGISIKVPIRGETRAFNYLGGGLEL